jgi:putative oxidoreductase
MAYLFLLGRLILGLYYVRAAVKTHFLGAKGAIGYAKSVGVPMPDVAVIGSGILLLIGGLSILTGWYVTLGVACLVLFLVPVSFMMHAFWKVADPQMRAMQEINFLKNMALLGGALMILAIPTPWTFTL